MCGPSAILRMALSTDFASRTKCWRNVAEIAQRKAMLIPGRRTEGQGRRVSRSAWG